MLDHLLCNFDVGDHAIAERANGLNVGGRLAHHQLGFVADNLDPPDPVARFECDYRRFVQNDTFVPHIDNGVHGPKVDSHVMRSR